jgi:hypothetical protein
VRLDANHGVDARVEVFPFVEDLNSEDIFLEVIGLTGEGLLDGVAQQAAQAAGVREGAAGQDLVKLRPDCFGGGTGAWLRAAVIGLARGGV